MKSARLMKILLLVLVIAVACGSWLGYTARSLSLQRDSLEQEVAGLEGRQKLLQKKIAEEKSLATGYLRGKSALESELRAADEKMAGLSREKELAIARLEEMKKQVSQGREELVATIDKLKANIGEWKSRFDELREESVSKIREGEEKNAALTAENQKLTASLNQEVQQHDRCKSNNAGLAGLSRELVEKYQHKDVLDSLAAKEPLTQLEKVELEKLMQEYLDRIDKQTR